MANLSNINNKFLVTTGGNVLIGQTTVVGSSIFQVTGTSTFAGEINVKNASTRFISLNYEDGINSIISHSGTSYGLESLNVRGDKIYFYTDYEAGVPKGDITLTLENSHNAKFEGNVGIGISPGATSLHIYKSDATALIQASNTSGIAQVQFFPRDASNVAHLQSIKGVDSSLTFLTGGSSGNSYVPTQRMRIDSGGSIMIGGVAPSGTPAADYRSLEIGRQGNTITGAPWKSNLYFSTNATITAGSSTFTARYLNELPTQMVMEDGLWTFSNAPLPSAVGDTVVWSEKMRITTSGLTIFKSSYVVAASYGGELNIGGSSVTTFGLQAKYNQGGATQSTLYSSPGYTSNDQLFLLGAGAGNTAQLVLKGNGNVGIGTTSPASKLMLQQDSGGATVLRLKNLDNLTSAGAVQNSIIMNGRYWSGDATSVLVETRINSVHQLSDGNGGSALTFETQTGGSGTTEKVRIDRDGNVGIGTASTGDAKLYVNGGTTLGGPNNTSLGSFNVTGDRKYPQANYFVKRNYKLTAGSSSALYSIARQWHDHANWGLGNINVIMWGVYYAHGNFSKADFSCRYGYSGGSASVQANFNPGSLAVPTWTAATQASGNIHYRDLQIQIPAYQQISFEIISPGCQQTYNVNNTAGNTVYLYPH